MKNITFNVDYTYCPKGHGDWIFVGSTTLYSNIFWCEKCNCFYEPSVRKVTAEDINKNFNSDRAKEIVKRAEFLKWKSGLSYKDMPQ